MSQLPGTEFAKVRALVLSLVTISQKFSHTGESPNENPHHEKDALSRTTFSKM